MSKKKLLTIVLAFALALGLCSAPDTAAAAAVRLNKDSVKVTVGKTITLKVKNTKKKAKWTVKSGKKYIRLTSKKKSSVKVQGVKKGTAEVQCRIGKKKLVCKIKVATKEKNQREVIAEEKPTITPNPTMEPCPTHIPTEDCLMAEPCKTYTLPTEDEKGQPIWRPFGNVFHYFFGSDVKRSGLVLVFATSNEVPASAEWSMDVSEKKNGSVMAWYMDTDGDGTKEMTIGQKGGVVANPNSSYLLCDIKTVRGLENLYTANVTDMSYMFKGYALTQGVVENKKLDLGPRFETSNVTNMRGMFAKCGYFEMEELYLGNYFDVSKVTDAVCMFDSASLMSKLTCYVKDEATKQWIMSEDNHTMWQGTNHTIELTINKK